jgi:HPt (histidine-containing phosphotransfer) domain-containing protein
MMSCDTPRTPLLVPESEPVLDRSVMAALRALGNLGEPDVYVQVAHLFLADVASQLSALAAAVDAASPSVVAEIAHRLRGGALEMGALRMSPLCAEIERAARTGSLEHAAAQMALLEREFEVTRAALEQAIA